MGARHRRGASPGLITSTTGYGAAEVADRLAIQDLIARYAVVIDNRDFDALDPMFTADARIDFTTFNGPVGGLAEIKAFLAASLPLFDTAST